MVIGISTDDLATQKKFAAKENLDFPLYADADKTAARAYGTLMPNGKYANRDTFVIDKQGVIRKIYRKVSPSKDAQETLDYVKEHLADKQQ